MQPFLQAFLLLVFLPGTVFMYTTKLSGVLRFLASGSNAQTSFFGICFSVSILIKRLFLQSLHLYPFAIGNHMILLFFASDRLSALCPKACYERISIVSGTTPFFKP